MDSTITASLITLGGALGAALVVVLLPWIRANRLRESEMRSLARELAAELYGFLVRWEETKVPPRVGRIALRHWSTPVRFPVYDEAAGRLSLLPRELAMETAACYAKLGVLQDKLRLAREREIALGPATAKEKRAEIIARITRAAQADAGNALGSAGRLASKLDEVSAAKHRPRASLARRFWLRCLRLGQRVRARFRRG
jgi:hypothetical protein